MPINHRVRTEDQINAIIQQVAGKEASIFGYLVRLISIGMPNGTSEYGWHLVVTMKNPEIGKGVLFGKADLPVLEIPHEFAVRSVTEMVEGLRDLRKKILSGGTTQNGAGSQ